MTPPPIRTSDPGSFAQRTFQTRIPSILRKTIDANDFDAPVRRAMEALRDDVPNGRVRMLVDDAPDRAIWDADVQPYLDRTWLDLPFWFAELYLYRRIAEAVRWHERGADPFLSQKRAEEQHASFVVDDGADLATRVLGALWGNRADLSLDARAHTDEARRLLLVDDVDAIAARLATARDVVIVADNAGAELWADLVLVDALLIGGARVRLQVKSQPMFVSDALSADVDRVVARSANDVARRVRAAIDDGRVVIEAHPFYATAGFFDALPTELRDAWIRADVVVVKGDANYRRSARDARWPPSTPAADALRGVPGRLAFLRTCKSDVMFGLPDGLAASLDVDEPDWRTSGRRGVVQWVEGASPAD